MKRKPLQILVDKVGYAELSRMAGVNLSTVYRWTYRESGKPNGRAPGLSDSLELVKIAKKHGVKSLTLEYLANRFWIR